MLPPSVVVPAAKGPAGPIGAAERSALFARLEKFGSLALGISGGRDSMALLRLIAGWASGRDRPPRVAALTVDHGLRPGSDREAAQVGEWCARLGIDHHVLEWTGPKPASRIQELAREARYGLLAGWCTANSTEALIVAHQLDDQAETVLMRLARASGVDGLAGMAEEASWSGVPLIRPLLGVSRARLTATLEALGQDWIEDPANADPAFERARLRRQASTFADAGLSAAAIAGSAAKLSRAAEALEIIAARAAAEAVEVAPEGFARIDRMRLGDQPDEIRRRLVASVVETVAGTMRASDAAVMRAVTRIADPPIRGFTLGGCRFSETDGTILVARELRGVPSVRLAAGAATVWDNRFAVSLTADCGPVEVRALGAAGFAAAKEEEESLADIPTLAGSALPGGFVNDDLRLMPRIAAESRGRGLLARFLR